MNVSRETPITFDVAGDPAPQGSMRAFVIPAKGARKARANVVPDNSRTKPWKSEVTSRATEEWMGAPTDGPVRLLLIFRFQRPKSHYGARGNLLPSAPRWKVTQPDVDKLARAVLDALTGIVFRDDAQVVDAGAIKRWADPEEGPGCWVEVHPL